MIYIYVLVFPLNINLIDLDINNTTSSSSSPICLYVYNRATSRPTGPLASSILEANMPPSLHLWCKTTQKHKPAAQTNIKTHSQKTQESLAPLNSIRITIRMLTVRFIIRSYSNLSWSDRRCQFNKSRSVSTYISLDDRQVGDLGEGICRGWWDRRRWEILCFVFVCVIVPSLASHCKWCFSTTRWLACFLPALRGMSSSTNLMFPPSDLLLCGHTNKSHPMQGKQHSNDTMILMAAVSSYILIMRGLHIVVHTMDWGMILLLFRKVLLCKAKCVLVGCTRRWFSLMHSINISFFLGA